MFSALPLCWSSLRVLNLGLVFCVEHKGTLKHCAVTGPSMNRITESVNVLIYVFCVSSTFVAANVTGEKGPSKRSVTIAGFNP